MADVSERVRERFKIQSQVCEDQNKPAEEEMSVDLELKKAVLLQIQTDILMPIHMVMETEIDRIAFINIALQIAEATCALDPLNANNLTMWGSALLELALYQQPQTAYLMIKEALFKFKGALDIDPQKAEALWCWGNAYTTLAFFIPDTELVVGRHLLRAQTLFEMACDVEPANPIYRKSLEMATKAPEFHAKFHKQVVAQEEEEAESSTKVATKKG